MESFSQREHSLESWVHTYKWRVSHRENTVWNPGCILTNGEFLTERTQSGILGAYWQNGEFLTERTQSGIMGAYWLMESFSQREHSLKSWVHTDKWRVSHRENTVWNPGCILTNSEFLTEITQSEILGAYWLMESFSQREHSLESWVHTD